MTPALIILNRGPQGASGQPALAKVTAIDATVVADHDLFTDSTVDSEIQGVNVRCVEATGITSPATLEIRVKETGDPFFGPQSLAGLDVVDKTAKLVFQGARPVLKAGQTLEASISTGATGTSQTIDIDVLGYRIT